MALPSIPKELLDKVGDVPTCDGNVLNRRADDVAFRLEWDEPTKNCHLSQRTTGMVSRKWHEPRQKVLLWN